MEQTRSSGASYLHAGAYLPEIAESLRFQEEIQSLIHPNSFDAKNSFTALLGLAPNQAVELLHDPDPGNPPGEASGAGKEMWRLRLGEHTVLGLPLGCSPGFPSNAAALPECPAGFAAPAAEKSPASSSCGTSGRGDGRSPKHKVEPPDSDSPPIRPVPSEQRPRPAKRKDADKNGKVKGYGKKSKCAEESTAKAAETATAAEGAGDGEKLPYVHVRARRGQATDSHSLAERARREKINARMKFLQELVPGCSKISGTALVLDEIINHVQSLQRQVEILSMRLAAVNPRLDFPGLDSFFLPEFGGWPSPGNGRNASWPSDQPGNGERQQIPQQIWVQPNQLEPQVPMTMWVRDDAHLNNNASASPPQNPPLAYSYASPGSLEPNQTKAEF